MGDDRLPARDRPATSVISKAPRRSISYRPEEPPSVFDQYVVNSATIFRSSRCSRANRFARYALPARDAHAHKDEQVSLRSDFNADQMGYRCNRSLTCCRGSLREEAPSTSTGNRSFSAS